MMSLHIGIYDSESSFHETSCSHVNLRNFTMDQDKYEMLADIYCIIETLIRYPYFY